MADSKSNEPNSKVEDRIDCRSGNFKPPIQHYDLSILQPRDKDAPSKMQRDGILPALSITPAPEEVVNKAFRSMDSRIRQLESLIKKPDAQREALLLCKRIQYLAALKDEDLNAAERQVHAWEESDKLDRIRIHHPESVEFGYSDYNLIHRSYDVQEKDGKIVVTETAQKQKVPLYGYHNWGASNVGDPEVSVRRHNPDDLIPVGTGSDTRMVRAADLKSTLESQEWWGNIAGAASVAMDAGLLVSGGIGIYSICRLGLKTVGWLAAARTAAITGLAVTGAVEDNAGALTSAPEVVSRITDARHKAFMLMAAYDLAHLGKAGVEAALIHKGLMAPRVVPELSSGAKAIQEMMNKSRTLKFIDRSAYYVSHGANFLFTGSEANQLKDNLKWVGAKVYDRYQQGH